MEDITLPNTDSPEVMERAICISLTVMIWKQIYRSVHDEEAEEKLLGIYDKIFRSVKKTHGGG